MARLYWGVAYPLLMPAAFAKLLEDLSEGGVQYLVVGGVAVGLNGFPRYTNDLDIIVEPKPENLRRLLAVLSAWGSGSAKELSISDFLPPELGSIRINEDFPLDAFVLMRSRKEGSVWDYAELARDACVHVSAKGIKIGFISIPRLIALKTGTGRAKDLVDLDVLQEIQGAGLETPPIHLEQIGPAPDAEEDAQAADEEWPL